MATCTGDSFVQSIERTECIGNSLVKINNNFAALDIALCKASDVTNDIYNINGILKSNGTGTITVATPGTHYYVPNTILQSLAITATGNITATGTLSAKGNIITNGNITATGDITAFASSDERLKKNIATISNALEKVSTIRGVEYEWNMELQDTHTGGDVGVIAQEIEKVLPTAVIDRDNGYKAVKYERIIPLLIEAIKDLKKEIDVLKR